MNEVGGGWQSATENRLILGRQRRPAGRRGGRALSAWRRLDSALVQRVRRPLNRWLNPAIAVRAPAARSSMSYRLHYRRYRLPLRLPVRTAHEVWTERVGLIVRLEDDRGAVGFGEVAPIPAFGTETVAEAEQACGELGDRPTAAQLAAVPVRLGCLRHALTMAAGVVPDPAEPEEGGSPAVGTAGGSQSVDAEGAPAYRAVAALLPAGRAALESVKVRAEAGFRVFKWKVGVGDSRDELALLDDLCAAIPAGARLRLDANGAWDRRRAEQWLERAADRPIEFVEQPHFVPVSAGESERRRADDLLLGLAHDFPTPIALDESVISEGDVARWLGQGWPGWYVVKPTLLGDAAGALAQLARAQATVVFSSALETAIGAQDALRRAFAWPGPAKALGFGVWPLFADGRFDGPAAAPFIRAADLERTDSEQLWNALS